MTKSKIFLISGAALLVIVSMAVVLYNAAQAKRETQSAFIMDTIVEQKVYGANAQKAITEVETKLRNMEERLSLYKDTSDIARINTSAGEGAVEVDTDTYALLVKAKQLALNSQSTFSLTIAPLTLAWGITGDAPRVVSAEEIAGLLPLVKDDDIILQDGKAGLARKGQAIDLGGVAKGAASDLARQIYEECNVKSALISFGGSSIYAIGAKPDGSEYRVGFRDPKNDATASIASFTIKDEALSTSGGYERFFEKDGTRYHHIIDPLTGAPAVSDIVSVGVMDKDGATADALSTMLYIKGMSAALEYMEKGGKLICLDENDNLYVSRALESSFELMNSENTQYKVTFVG